MNHVLTILRREMGAQFRSPLAYVFLVLFLVATELLYMLLVFPQGRAEMQFFFDYLPWLIVIFASLVTMHAWAEERQANTYEMLLTFPMRDRHLVIAKFLAAYLFMAIGILGTLTLPIMLGSLGEPDKGAILGGYVGALLFAALACAAGVFYSSITRSQLLAALLTLVTGLLSLLVGTDAIAGLINGVVSGLGTFLRNAFGSWHHYTVFSCGVIELWGVFFFVAWTAIFLHLNTLFVALRRAPGSWPRLAAASALALACGGLASRLAAEGSLHRTDLTQDKLYTLSPGTLGILAQAEVPVQVKYYVSPQDEMPTEYRQIEREVTDRMNELQVASHDKLVFSVVHLKPGNLVITAEEEDALDEEEGLSLTEEGEKTEEQKKAERQKAKERLEQKEKSVERRLYDKGVRPFAVASEEATQVSTKLIYSSIGVAYREKDEDFLPPIQPKALAELEYQLANSIAKIVRPEPPKIALVTGKEPMDPQLEQMYKQAGQEIPDPFSAIDDLLRAEKYQVERVKLSAQEPMPERYDALVVLGPVNLNARQKWEIGRALREGRPTLLALHRTTWGFGHTRQGLNVHHEETETGLEELLAENGISVSKQLLMDANKIPLDVPNEQRSNIFNQSVTVDMPMHILVKASGMNRDSAITQRLSTILYLWGSALVPDRPNLAQNDMKVVTLLSSSEKSWEVPEDRPLRQSDISPDGKKLDAKPLCLLVEGQFKDPEEGKPRPTYPPNLEFDPRTGRPQPAPPDRPETPVQPARGKLIVFGSGRMFTDGFLRTNQIGNRALLLNCIDALTLDENLLLVRAKQPTDRRFDKPSSTEAVFWIVTPLVLVPLAIVGAGIGIAVLRLRRRERWNEAHGRWRP